MAAYNKINSFTLDLGNKVHNLSSDALTIALTTTANKPVATNTVLANLTQISYTNLSARVPTITSWSQASGVAKLILADLVLTASGAVAAFGAVVLYNDTPSGTPTDPLIAWWEYGSDVTLANTETFTIDFDGTNGVLTVG
jgi:hypothetical protein